MTTRLHRAGALALALLSCSLPAQATRHGHPDAHFERISTFPVFLNSGAGTDETVAEIVDATRDGKTLVYTDGKQDQIGFVDIRDPADPQPDGFVAVAGEPTSVAVVGRYAVAGVNTSADFVNVSGHLAVIDIKRREIVAELDLGGQPDSVAVSPNGRYIAVAIENERDEDIEVDGVEGGLPQLPAGYLAIVDVRGKPHRWRVRRADLSGLPGYGSSDPEPEFVDINHFNIAAVSLQENNSVALVYLPTGRVLTGFDAGTVDLDNVDILEEDIISLDGSLRDIPREPDALSFLGNWAVVTANEGDLFGGSRGFSIFSIGGRLLWDSAEQFEYSGVRIGHYPEGRSENKGTEPEGVEVARFGRDTWIFVNSERGSFINAYRLGWRGPQFVQSLPTSLGPEGLKAIPKRNLFVVASEEDNAADGFRSSLSIYRLQRGEPSYPQVVSSDDANGLPIPWGALSALAADRDDADTLYTVHDSVYNASRIYTMDVSQTPAVITAATVLSRDGATVDYDLEGLVQRSNGGFWAVSEGRGSVDDPNRPVESNGLLLMVAADGSVLQEVALPDGVNAAQRRHGLEGVAVTGSAGADETVYVAFQRELATDPEGLVRIGVYTPPNGDSGDSNGHWAFYHYPLDAPESPAGGWVGLSEIVATDDGDFLVIERDNKGVTDARVKRIYRVALPDAAPVADGGTLPLVDKTLVRDLLPDLIATNGPVEDKVEGLTIGADGTLYVVTDNDGVDDSDGSTYLLRF